MLTPDAARTGRAVLPHHEAGPLDRTTTAVQPVGGGALPPGAAATGGHGSALAAAAGATPTLPAAAGPLGMGYGGLAAAGMPYGAAGMGTMPYGMYNNITPYSAGGLGMYGGLGGGAAAAAAAATPGAIGAAPVNVPASPYGAAGTTLGGVPPGGVAGGNYGGGGYGGAGGGVGLGGGGGGGHAAPPVAGGANAVEVPDAMTAAAPDGSGAPGRMVAQHDARTGCRGHTVHTRTHPDPSFALFLQTPKHACAACLRINIHHAKFANLLPLCFS